MSAQNTVCQLVAMEVIPQDKAMAMMQIMQQNKIDFDFVVDTRIAKLWLADRLNPNGDCFVLTPGGNVLYTLVDLQAYVDAQKVVQSLNVVPPVINTIVQSAQGEVK